MSRRNKDGAMRQGGTADTRAPPSSQSVPSARGQSSLPRPAAVAGRRGAWLGAALLALAAVAVYYNSFSAAFVFDDLSWIENNPAIRHLWPIWPLLSLSDPVIGGRPVVSLTLASNYAIGGTDVRGYHVVNLAIHILAAWTLFAVVRRTLLRPKLAERFAHSATPLAFAAALLWTVHPLQTESVTYIVQRTESLAALFYLLTLYCVIRGAESAGRGTGWYVAAVASCALGMATKETVATTPVVVLLYDWIFLSGSLRAALAQRGKLYAALAATWGIVAAVLISTNFHNNTAGSGAGGFTPWNYFLTQPSVLVHYLRLVFWPTGQCLDYGWPPASGRPESFGPVC